jgi:nucleotide sugar dehydrogenase
MKTEDKKKIGIVGFGYVGKGTANLFSDHYDVLAHDPAYWPAARYSGPLVTHKETLAELIDCEVVIICVPTPMADDGACDTSIVESVLTEIWQHKRNTFYPLVVLRSTVPPRTTRRLEDKMQLGLVFWPEFAGEGRYWTQYAFRDNAKAVPFVILGGDKPFTKRIVDLLVPILGPEKRYIQTDSQTAEMAKYMINTWLAVKVGFCNDMFDICEKLGVDYRAVRELWLQDPRINESHTAVFPDSRGFHGKCTPKDSLGLLRCAEAADCHDTELRTLRAVIDTNRERRPEVYG